MFTFKHHVWTVWRFAQFSHRSITRKRYDRIMTKHKSHWSMLPHGLCRHRWVVVISRKW